MQQNRLLAYVGMETDMYYIRTMDLHGLNARRSGHLLSSLLRSFFRDDFD